jgi:hypothetical protein
MWTKEKGEVGGVIFVFIGSKENPLRILIFHSKKLQVKIQGNNI